MVEFVALKSMAEIAFPHKLVLDNFFRRTRGDRLSVVEYVCFVGYLKCPLDIMVGNQDTNSGSDKPPDLDLEFLYRYRVAAYVPRADIQGGRG